MKPSTETEYVEHSGFMFMLGDNDIESPTDCESCQESNFLDKFGNQRDCGQCSLWHKSYDQYLDKLETMQK